MIYRNIRGCVLVAIIAGSFGSQSCAGSQAAPPDAWAQHQAISQTTQVLFRAGDFATLEKQAADYRGGSARTLSGYASLDLFYNSFDAYSPYGDIDDPRIGSVKRWIAAYPRSATALIVMGILLKDQALAFGQLAHTSGLAGTNALMGTAPEKFVSRLLDAERFLKSHEKQLRDDPYYYRLLIDVASLRGATEQEIMGLFLAGQNRTPANYGLAYQALIQLADKWNYDKSRIDAFIREATDASQPQEGDSFYVNLYWWMSVTHYKWKLFEEVSADWPRLKRGMADMLKRYPGPYNANRYALMACLAGDRQTTKSMLDQVGLSPDADVWQARQYIDQCWTWSHGGTGRPLGVLAEFMGEIGDQL